MGKCRLAALLLIAACTYTEAFGEVSKDVIELIDNKNKPDADFETQTSIRGAWFVKFYAPWCGHCKKLAPEWGRLATYYKETGDGFIRIAQVNCVQNQKLCKQWDVSAYPALKVFFNADEYYRYSGPREFTALRRYIEEIAEELRGEEID